MYKLQKCFREPITEIFKASEYLNQALDFHLHGNFDLAAKLIVKANFPEIREWTESIWGAKSPYIKFRSIENSLPKLKKAYRFETRMPDKTQKAELIRRDGHICVFCGIPLIRTEVRKEFQRLYPAAMTWGRRNIEQHSAFQAMWLQYDHLVPHSRGGINESNNIVITCAPCNFGRMEYTLEEVGLMNPWKREKVLTDWNGLENILD